MPRRLRTIACTILALGAVLALSACGGGGDGAEAILKQTFSGKASVRSGNLIVSLHANLAGIRNLKGPLNLELKGPFQSSGKGQLPEFDLTLNLQSNGSTVNAGAVSTGDKGFLRFQNQAYSVPASLFTQFKKGYAQAQGQAQKKGKTPTFSSLGIHPADWLDNAKNAGTATVGGADTVHITAGIRVPKLLDSLGALLKKTGALGIPSTGTSQGLTAHDRDAIERSVKSAHVDVYAGKSDHILRKLAVNVQLEVPADLQKSHKVTKGSVSFVLEIDAVNESQTITAPTGAAPLTDLLTQLGLGGAASALGGKSVKPNVHFPPSPLGGTATTPSAGPPTSPVNNPAYLKCLTTAKGDLTKVQACAKIINGK